MTQLQAALDAQRRGFHIFPVTPGAKTPHRAAGSWGETATNDFNQIVHFWAKVDPNANIGVACKPSNLLVAECLRIFAKLYGVHRDVRHHEELMERFHLRSSFERMAKAGCSDGMMKRPSGSGMGAACCFLIDAERGRPGSDLAPP